VDLHTSRLTEVEFIEGAKEFAALEEEWAELYENCPSATPFQSWAWLYSWWEHYGEGYELRLITVRSGNLLVGLLPLMLDRRLGFGRLLFVASRTTDYLDILAREGWEDSVAEAGVAALEEMGGWRVADLQEMRPEAAAWVLSQNWPGLRARTWQSNCPVTDVKPLEELLPALKRKRRSSVRRALNRAEADGLHPRLVDPEDAENAARRLVALHRDSWQGRGIGLEHMDRKFEMFLETAAHRMTARGLGAISEFRRDGEVVVSHFAVFGRDLLGGYILGANQHALQRYQVSSLCIWDALNLARDRGLPYVSHLRGEEPFKLQWSSRVVPNHRSILGQTPLSWALYTGYQILRSKVETYADSETAPRWVRRIVVKYRALRLKAAGPVENKTRQSWGGSADGADRARAHGQGCGEWHRASRR
jgi:CelD/BcsL family acetyltransferase involved in cellulose biosynthesis